MKNDYKNLIKIISIPLFINNLSGAYSINQNFHNCLNSFVGLNDRSIEELTTVVKQSNLMAYCRRTVDNTWGGCEDTGGGTFETRSICYKKQCSVQDLRDSSVTCNGEFFDDSVLNSTIPRSYYEQYNQGLMRLGTSQDTPFIRKISKEIIKNSLKNSTLLKTGNGFKSYLFGVSAISGTVANTFCTEYNRTFYCETILYENLKEGKAITKDSKKHVSLKFSRNYFEKVTTTTSPATISLTNSPSLPTEVDKSSGTNSLSQSNLFSKISSFWKKFL